MRNAFAIFRKQIKDTLKNKTVLIQFVMFPILTLIMDNAVQIEGMPENFFVNMFASMYLGMAPLTSMAAVIAEEKEKNTLRVLMMSNVKPWEYLLGTGSYVWLACMCGAGIIGTAGNYGMQDGMAFMGIMAAGTLVSLLAGAAIGTFSRNQMMATSITVPVMIIFSFMPMLSMFNAAISRIAKFIYTEQISLLLAQVTGICPDAENICIIAVNMLAATGMFTFAYKKCGLE